MSEGGPRMSFVEHLEEFRQRLLKCIGMLLLMVVLAVAFQKELSTFAAGPHFEAQALLKVPEEQRRLMAVSYTESMIAAMKLAFLSALFASSPWVGWQLWQFVGAGLTARERGYVRRFAPVSFALFSAGCVFGFKVLVPYALYGLASQMNLDIVSPQYTFSEYLGFVMMLTIILGGVFQVPLLMVFLSRIGLVRPPTWGRWRRAAVVANLVFAAVVTPADLLTMLLVTVPMLALYEAGALAATLMARP